MGSRVEVVHQPSTAAMLRMLSALLLAESLVSTAHAQEGSQFRHAGRSRRQIAINPPGPRLFPVGSSAVRIQVLPRPVKPKNFVLANIEVEAPQGLYDFLERFVYKKAP